jgi:hypothetical protein
VALLPGGAGYSTRSIDPKRQTGRVASQDARRRMATIIKIVLTLLVLTCCFQAARYALNNFQFEDAVQQRLLFDTRATDTEVVKTVMAIAQEYAITLKVDDISIQMIGQDRVVDMPYTVTVDLLPGIFEYPWTFTPKASTRLLTGISPR